MGGSREDVGFPVPPPRSDMDAPYATFINELKQCIRNERTRVMLSANKDLILFYFDIGSRILVEQERYGWGAHVIDRIATDLKETFPELTGFSARNLKYMRKFAKAWQDRSFVQRTVAQIPWRTNLALLDKLQDKESRLWYARKTIEMGWSKDILDLQIETKLIERQGREASNFKATLPPDDSDLTHQIFKDPYLFDFLGTAEIRRETELEQALMSHISKFLLELGQGFAFVGRQVHLEFADADFYLDLLFYHLKLRRYVVVELKAQEFKPEFLGQLSMYQSAVDDLLCTPEDKPTIGLLLVKNKNKMMVEYSLHGIAKPMGVADWKQQVLPEEIQLNLPTIEQIEHELGMLEDKTINDSIGDKGDAVEEIENAFE